MKTFDVFIHIESTLQHQLICFHVDRRAAGSFTKKTNHELFCNIGSYIILDFKNISELAIITFRPHLYAIFNIDQLCIDAYIFSYPPYAAFKYRRNGEQVTDFVYS